MCILRCLSSNGYSFCERILRIAVFQMGVINAGRLESVIFRIFNMFTQKTCFPVLYEPKRAEKGLQSLINLGGQVQYVTPKDGLAKIQMMTLRSDVLEEKLKQFGARWEKIQVGNEKEKKAILAIIPPEKDSKEWHAFETDLSRLKWKKQQIPTKSIPLKDYKWDKDTIDVIVTCEAADAIPESEFHKNLFLHANSASVSFVMLTGRIGFYLGCKQNVCAFDPRGSGGSIKDSQGATSVPSEAGYYNDISAVYDKIKDSYDPIRVRIGGACGGCSSAAYLISKIHERGPTLILENGYNDLKTDFTLRENCIVRFFANRYWNSLKDRFIKGDKPPETGFNLRKTLEGTKVNKIIIIRATNDQLLPPEVDERNVKLAREVGENVFHVCFHSTKKGNAHGGRYFYNPEKAREFLTHLFKTDV